MARFLAKRVALGLITLFVLSIVIFLAAQVLPGDVGRRILGPFADQQSVDALNHKLGADQSLIKQYWDWISSFVTGDLGTSVQGDRPVSDVLFTPLVASAKL